MHAWTTDIRRAPDGTIAAVLTARVDDDLEDHPDRNHPVHDIRFYAARLSPGSEAWQLVELAEAGGGLLPHEQDYTGLAAIDPYDIDSVYISTPVDPRTRERLAHYEIFHGTTSDAGITWSWTPITEDSPYDNLRPIVAPGDANRIPLLWFRGEMTASQHYRCEIRAARPAAHHRRHREGNRMTTVLLVGAHGYGSVHLRNLERLGDRVELVGLVDPKGGPTDGFGSATPSWQSLDAALATGIHPDIVIVATPTNTHFGLAALALEHGSHVYLEKPPVATMEQFTDLLALQERTGRAIQVGFQSFGSHALTEIAELGGATSVATWANWSREFAYWNRSAWAGKRTLDGQPVVDGVLTNALSHAVATALHIAGARRREDIARIELELYRANDIEADDTSSVRITLTDGRVVSAALTLAGAAQDQPLIEVRTASADVLFSYTDDVITYPDGRVSRPGRIELFEQFLDHLEHGAAQLSALVDSGAYMEVLEAVRTAPAPTEDPGCRDHDRSTP